MRSSFFRAACGSPVSATRSAGRSAARGSLRPSTTGIVRRAIAGGLISLGVKAGDRVAILANTRREWLFTDVGIVMSGAVTVPIYQSNLPHECEYILNDAGVEVVFVENPLQLRSSSLNATSSAPCGRSC